MLLSAQFVVTTYFLFPFFCRCASTKTKQPASATDSDLEDIKVLAKKLSEALKNFADFYDFLLKEAGAL